MSKTVTVGISDLNVVRSSDVLVTYALGSCAGICLYDPVTHIAGMSHIMLPSSGMAHAAGQEYRFADTGIVALVKKMTSMGANPSRLKAKIAGGAQMFACVNNKELGNIGARNVIAVKETLAKLRIPIIAEDTGKDYGRTLYFYAETGLMKVKSAKQGEWIW